MNYIELSTRITIQRLINGKIKKKVRKVRNKTKAVLPSSDISNKFVILILALVIIVSVIMLTIYVTLLGAVTKATPTPIEQSPTFQAQGEASVTVLSHPLNENEKDTATGMAIVRVLPRK